MGSDAQWLAENVILPRLDALDTKLDARDRATQKREEKMWDAIEDGKRCATKTKLKVVDQNGRLNSLEEHKDDLDKHIGNEEAHFNKKKAEQTNLGYLAKKKMLIIFLTALGILVSTATGLIVAWMNGAFGV